MGHGRRSTGPPVDRQRAPRRQGGPRRISEAGECHESGSAPTRAAPKRSVWARRRMWRSGDRGALVALSAFQVAGALRRGRVGRGIHRHPRPGERQQAEQCGFGGDAHDGPPRSPMQAFALAFRWVAAGARKVPGRSPGARRGRFGVRHRRQDAPPRAGAGRAPEPAGPRGGTPCPRRSPPRCWPRRIAPPLSEAAAQTRLTYKSAKSTSSYYEMAVQIAEAVKQSTGGDLIDGRGGGLGAERQGGGSRRLRVHPARADQAGAGRQEDVRGRGRGLRQDPRAVPVRR